MDRSFSPKRPADEVRDALVPCLRLGDLVIGAGKSQKEFQME